MAIGDKIPVEAIKKVLAENPVLKWVVVGVVAILAVEFLAREAIGLWKEVATAQLEVEKKNLENQLYVGWPDTHKREPLLSDGKPPVSDEQRQNARKKFLEDLKAQEAIKPPTP